MILKHFIKITAATIIFASMGFTTSCSDDGPNNPPVTYDKEVKAKGYYTYEGKTEDGLGNFIFCFTTANVNDSNLSGPGDVYFFDVYSQPSTASTPTPKTGTYKFDAGNTYKEWTFAEDDSYFGTVASGSDEVNNEVAFTDGTLTVSVSGTKVTAEALVTLNGKQIKLTSTSFSYIAEEVEIRDLNRDVDLDISLSKARINGDFYQNNTMSYILLGYVNEADEDRFYLDLIAPQATDPSGVALLPAGTYTIGSEPKEFTCLAGTNVDGSYDGSWYDNISKAGELGLLAEGTVTVSVADGMIYTLEIDAVTNLGHKVKGHYKGYVMHYNPQKDNPTWEPESSTTLETKDYIMDLSSVTTGSVFFFGDVYNIEMGVVVVDLDPAAGSKQGLAMKFLVPNPDLRMIEEGTYKASYNAEPYIFMNGYIEKNTFEPTTFYIYDAQAKGTDVQAPLQVGAIKITQDGANWNFEVDAYDDANNHVKGSWSGPLEIKKS